MTNINKNCRAENSLIDYFVIIGDHNYFNCPRSSNTKDNYSPVINPFKPTILNYVPSIYCNKPKIDEDLLIKLIFSKIFDEFNKNEGFKNSDNNFSNKNIILSLKQRYNNDNVFNNYIFAYVFKHKNFIYPQAFCIISEYPYFNFFRSFTEGIVKAFQNYDFKIPLEISLYNMINYIPPSINSSINIQSIPQKDISLNFSNDPPDYKGGLDSNVQPKKVTNYLLNQTYCFPYFDFKITEIIKVFSPELLTKIIIFNYLEVNMIFFSENQETLNFSLYILSKLLYPFDNIPYYDDIYSISKEDFIKGNRRVQSESKESKIYGVNSVYDKSILPDIRAKSCFIVDIEKQKIIYNENNNSSASIKVVQIFDYVTKILDYLSNQKHKKPNDENILGKSQFLFSSIKNLLNHLQEVEKKLKKKEEINFFEKISDKAVFDENINFQNCFFTFHLELLVKYYSFFKLKSNCDNLLKHYDKIQLTINRYHIEIEENYEEFEFQEILFYDLLKRTRKINNIMSGTPIEKRTNQNNIISFSFFEVFLKNLSSNYSKGNENYYLIMKNYFHNTNLVKSTLNFAKFHSFYEKNFKKWIECEINSEPLSLKNDNCFYYNLSEKIIQKYSYYLNNLSINEIKDLFPFTKYFNKSNIYYRFSFSFYLLKSEILQRSEISDFIFANILILSSMLISVNGIEAQISSLFNSELINSIYYGDIICLFISIYYKIIKKANDSNKKQIINITRIFIEYLTKKNTLPNQKVLEEINYICSQESKISEILHKSKNKEDVLPFNYSKKFKIDFESNKNNFDEIKKKIVPYIKSKIYIFKEMDNFLFKISINNKNYKGITLLSPLDLLDAASILLEEFQEQASYQHELMTRAISNIFFYLEYFTEFNLINCECFETVLSQSSLKTS